MRRKHRSHKPNLPPSVIVWALRLRPLRHSTLRPAIWRKSFPAEAAGRAEDRVREPAAPLPPIVAFQFCQTHRAYAGTVPAPKGPSQITVPSCRMCSSWADIWKRKQNYLTTSFSTNRERNLQIDRPVQRHGFFSLRFADVVQGALAGAPGPAGAGFVYGLGSHLLFSRLHTRVAGQSLLCARFCWVFPLQCPQLHGTVEEAGVSSCLRHNLDTKLLNFMLKIQKNFSYRRKAATNYFLHFFT